MFKKGHATVADLELRYHMSRYIVTPEEKSDWVVMMEDYYRLKRLEEIGFVIGS